MADKWITPQNPAPTAQRCRRIYLPDDNEWVAAVNGALIELTKEHNWSDITGGQSPNSVAAAFGRIFDQYSADDCMIGVLFPYISDTLPSNALACSGQTLLRVDYPILYAKMDAVWHVDADHFKLPDCRARAVVGSSAAAPPGLTPKAMGATGGEEAHVLTTAEMPAHVHSESAAAVSVITVGTGAPAPSATAFGSNTGSTGGGGSHNNMQPYIGLRWAIWAK